jgi:hypothetical protein
MKSCRRSILRNGILRDSRVSNKLVAIHDTAPRCNDNEPNGDRGYMHTRVTFTLEQDSSGYPPTSTERLWAVELSNHNFRIDNIPFYVFGISCGDEVSVDDVDGEWIFRKLVKATGNSTFRLFLTDPQRNMAVRGELSALGCQSEFNQLVGILAVEVPEATPIQPFLDYVMSAERRGDIEVEEGALRHPTRDMNFLK